MHCIFCNSSSSHLTHPPISVKSGPLGTQIGSKEGAKVRWPFKVRKQVQGVLSADSDYSVTDYTSQLSQLFQERDNAERAIVEFLGKLNLNRPSRETLLKNEPQSDSDFNFQYSKLMLNYLDNPMLIPSPGKIETVRIVGMLRDRSIAWSSAEDQKCGRIEENQLGALRPEPGATIRIRYAAYPWGCLTLAVMPDSLLQPGDAPKTSTPQLRENIPAEAQISDLVNLKPGDIVVARVPYDGHNPIDKKSRIAKKRPAIFRRWENEYALLHPIYDASGYVGTSGLGVQLIDTSLPKPSVARRNPYDISIKAIKKKVGRLGPRDLKSLGFESEDPHSPLHQKPSNVVSTEPMPVIDTDVETWKTIFKDFGDKLIVPESANSTDVLELLIFAMLENEHTCQQLKGSGIPYSLIGQVYVVLLKRLRIAHTKGEFSSRISSALSGVQPPQGWHFERRNDESSLPNLHLVSGHQGEALSLEIPIVRNSIDVSFLTGMVSFEVPENYDCPDLVLMDQASTSRLLGGNRVDFEQVRQVLGDGEQVRCAIITDRSTDGTSPLHYAARQKGWEIHEPSSDGREPMCETATQLALNLGCNIVTVISQYSDIVASLENVGIHVQIVNEITH